MNCFEYIERKGTDSVKWHPKGMSMMANYVDDESIPLWVADMDFKTVPLAIKKFKERVEHGIFGYCIPCEGYYTAVQYWYHKHYQWDINKDWIVTIAGIVPALAYTVQTFSKEGDGIIIQEPVYYPFRALIEQNERVVLNNGLIEKNGHYSIDFNDLQKKAQDPKTTMMILCSPHNPIGRIWAQEELTKVAQICYDNKVLLCSDEIHSDLVLFGDSFYTCGKLPPNLLENTIIYTAPSKTFNLAGIATSNIIIPNPVFKEKYTLLSCIFWFGICYFWIGTSYIIE